MALEEHGGATVGGKDHFSLLPNEIIEEIFEYVADYSQWPGGALISKRSSPLYQRTLYTNIQVANLESLSRLLRTLRARPSLGTRAKYISLMTDCTPPPAQKQELEIHQVLRLIDSLPNLRDFCSFWYIPALPFTFPISQTIRSITLTVAPDDSVGLGKVSLSDIAMWIRCVPAVAEVELYQWNFVSSDPDDWLYGTLDDVTSLQLSGIGVTEEETADLINACPSLQHLSLFLEPYIPLHVPPAFDTVLDWISSCYGSLTSLRLASAVDNVPVGLSLAKFTNLSSLVLGTVGSFPLLHHSVLQLVNLVNLTIGNRNDNFDPLLELVQGPTRLPNLRQLSLNQATLRKGRRFDPEDPEHVKEEENRYKRLERWSKPDARLLEPHYWQDFEVLVNAAESAGVRVGGRLVEARQNFAHYLLEINNLAIAKAYYHHDFRDIPQAFTLANKHDFGLPELDFESLESDKLELVKVECPELEWFALTLKDKK
ncbi:uncharacterized protein JCM6883_000285 [Sporobolomyces salmoneus]|uniref:uncharacterized protein n=1 Tax=Sporobolomyces salmoneus TaxID=183962 RepID=UPI00317A4010